ncbi:hypothetical protein J6590_060507 [Homalodisca vitripennis]|nr:hypothetical protein J6590_060507 [Homalodisca vitripennis]
MTKADEQRHTKKEECKVGRRGIAGLAQQRVRLTGDLATTLNLRSSRQGSCRYREIVTLRHTGSSGGLPRKYDRYFALLHNKARSCHTAPQSMRSNICGNGDALMMHRGVSVARQAEQAGPSELPFSSQSMRSNICGNGDALMMHRGVSVARQAEQAGPSDVPCTVTAARHTLALMVTAEGRTPARVVKQMFQSGVSL